MTTYFRSHDGATVPDAEALDALGRVKAGYGIRRPHRLMDSATRTPVTDIAITDAIGMIDAHPALLGEARHKIVVFSGSLHSDSPFVVEDAARNATAFAGRLATLADGYGPHPVTAAEKAQFKRVSEYVSGMAAGMRHRADELRAAGR
jgi:hypothetical protein